MDNYTKSRIRYLEKSYKSVIDEEAKNEILKAIKALKNNPERAHDEDGHFASDDPATPKVNEAWVGGKSPKSKGKK